MKDFAPHQESLELKELGFDEPCFGEWQNLKTGKNLVVDDEDRIYNIPILGADIKAPTFSQAFRWFREKYDLFCWIEKFHKDETYIFQIPPANFTKIQGHFNTYEEAELACLKKLIEIVKNK